MAHTDIHRHEHSTDRVEDPVCGMTLDPTRALSSDYKGETYHFCSEHCRANFGSDPDRYLERATVSSGVPDAPQHHAEQRNELAGLASARAPANAKMTYTCPMHAQIVRDEPGFCPICGMALEPRTVTLDEPDNPELQSMSQRFWVSLALTLPLLIVSMSEMVPGLDAHQRIGEQAYGWLQALLATPVVLWGGSPFFERMWFSFITRKLNMFTLIGIGTAAAYLFSLVALLFPGVLPASFKSMRQPAALLRSSRRHRDLGIARPGA